MATFLESVKESLQGLGGRWSEKKGLWECSAVIAERKAFLSTKKLTYSLRLRVDEAARSVHFSEMLTEAGSGLSTGGDLDSGFGFKKETYNTIGGARQGGIEEQSKQFGKDYTYRFNYAEVRGKVKAAAEAAGYTFEYQVLPVK